jgi:hypothetical protein
MRKQSTTAAEGFNLEQLYTAAALVGLLSAQVDEPDQNWLCTWAHDIGDRMAKESRRRERSRRRQAGGARGSIRSRTDR